MIQTKASNFAWQIGINDFKASNGWMHRFAKRNSLKMHHLHGEASSADQSTMEADIDRIASTIERYDKENIFNFDETALFFKAAPRSTIAKKGFAGWKEQKKRITVGLLCNADGSIKWEPLIIGHAKRPDAFKINGKPRDATDHGFNFYYHNSNAWMTKRIFHTFIRRFDRAMKARQRKVLLLLDNFNGHMIDYQPTNVEILFLPPNTTSYLQPLDGGIIRAFKAHFKRRQMDRAYRYIGMTFIGHQDKVGAVKDIFDVDQLQAMKWTKNAWKSVSQETIQHCWEATIYRSINKHKGVDLTGKKFHYVRCCSKN